MNKKSKSLGIYKSQFERQLHEGPLKSCEYEPFELMYKAEREYTPDFCPKTKNIIFEAKGRFRTYAEAQKYLDIKASHPDLQLIFVFQNPDTKAYPQCKRRKDGSILTLGEWATKNGFTWCCPTTIKKEWLQ